MKNSDAKKRLYLYSHSPEAEKLIDSGEAIISSGGVRSKDGTMKEMAKPLSFTIEELKEMISDDKHLITTDEKVEALGTELELSQQGIKELSEIGWLNSAAIGQVYSLTSAGFERTLEGLSYISENITNLGQYIQQKDVSEIREKTDKSMSNLKSYNQKLGLSKFDVTNSNIENHLNEIAAFIRRLYEDLHNGDINGFLYCSIIQAIIVPFSTVVRKYAIRFFYDNGVAPGSFNKWVELINLITQGQWFRDKLQYYINLETDLPYRDKVLLGRKCIKRIAPLPNMIAFDAEYALYHTQEEYLSMNKRIKQLLLSSDSFDDEEKRYL